MPNLDDYLKGKPLNEHLEALMNGAEDDEDERDPVSNLAVMPSRGERPLDDDDREHLRRLKLEPGWPILLRMLDNRIRKQEDACNVASKMNPFDKDLPSKWAAVGALEEVRRSLVVMLDNEVSLIKAEVQK